MLTIYDHPESVCCQKVRLALYEKGVAFENIHVAIDEGEQYTEKILKLNPKGIVPVAVHGGKVICESTIISEYIDDAFAGPGLMPTDAYWRARKRYWSRVIDDSIHLPHTTALSFIIAFRFVFERTLDTPKKLEAYLNNVRNPANRAIQREAFELGYGAESFREALRAFDEMLADMQAQLVEQPWLAGSDISLADLDIAPYIHRLESLELIFMVEDYPAVVDWYQRLKSRGSWAQAITRKHTAKWVGLMADTGKQAVPVVKDILEKIRT